MSLTSEQVDALLAPLDPSRVKQVQGQAHLESWDVKRHLIRVFGWGGFTVETVSCDCILERSFWSDKPNEPFKGRHSVAYRVVLRLVIRDADGKQIAHFEDGAVGDAQNQPSFSDAHDMALKTAYSQAIKRCAIYLGDRFGLSLYNGGGTKAVVGRTVAHTSTKETEVSESVERGELDEQRHAPDDPSRPFEPSSTAAEMEARAREVASKAREKAATS